MTDRIVQEALKLVLEPIFEADFEPVLERPRRRRLLCTERQVAGRFFRRCARAEVGVTVVWCVFLNLVHEHLAKTVALLARHVEAGRLPRPAARNRRRSTSACGRSNEYVGPPKSLRQASPSFQIRRLGVAMSDMATIIEDFVGPPLIHGDPRGARSCVPRERLICGAR